MSFKLSKSDRKYRRKTAADLRALAAEIEEHISAFNAVISERRVALQEAVEAYNNTLYDAEIFAQYIVDTAHASISDKSDSWQDSENGQAAIQWMDEWEALEFNFIEIEIPDEITYDPLEHANELEAVPASIVASV